MTADLWLLYGGLVFASAWAGGPLVKAWQIRRLRQLCRQQQALVLTYDDGPGGELTPAVLKLLAAAGARATFFPTGRSARANPDLLSRVAAAGHEVGCHSDGHLNARRVFPWRAVGDISRGYDALARWITNAVPYRPPYGKLTLTTWWALRRRGAPLAWWTVDSGDTHATLPGVESVVERVLNDGGGIVLMHDFDRDPSTRVARHAHVLGVTAGLLQLAWDEGLRLCTFGELLRLGCPVATPRVVAAEARLH